MRWFCVHLHVFPLAFIRFRFYFTVFWQSNLRFPGDSIKCVPFACIPKKWHIIFLQTWHVSISSSERTAIAVVCTLGHPEVVGKSSKCLKNTAYFTHKICLIFVDFKLWCLSLPLVLIGWWKKKEKFSNFCILSENLKFFGL